MKEKLEQYLRAGYPCLYIQSHEEQRVNNTMVEVAHAMGEEYKVYSWSLMQGIVELTGDGGSDCADAYELLMHITDAAENTIWILQDFHLLFRDEQWDMQLIRMIKDCANKCKTQCKHVLIVGCRRLIPPELERLMTFIEFSLPNRDELSLVVDTIAKGADLKVEDQQREPIISALQGLTTSEAEEALALSFIRNRAYVPNDIAREKAQAVKKSGILEVIDRVVTMDEIGGLDNIKEFARLRSRCFSKEAKAFGLPTPKGILALGLPGTGKSLISIAFGAAFGVPILKLDMGRIFGSFIGESEANIRSAIETARAMAPCILWLDEIDKGIGGSSSGKNLDGGTSDRVLATLLTWMQEKTDPVFIMATANDPQKLSASDGALIRKGRFDEVFFVDLPHLAERLAIWNVQIRKYHRDPSKFGLDVLAEVTEGFTGAEIEACVRDGLYRAFDSNEELDESHLLIAIENTTPLSKTMKESMDATRKWAANRCQPASKNPRTESDNGSSAQRKLKVAS